MITFLRNVITMMTKNEAFPTPSPALDVVKSVINDLEVKAAAALNRGRVEVAARRAAQVEVLALARQLGNYVESNCGGSVEVLLSSGFDAQRAASAPQMPGKPLNPSFLDGNASGSMFLRFSGDGSGNTRNYSVQYAENISGPWIDRGIVSNTKVEIRGLTPGKVYFGRARAHSAAGSSDWPGVAARMAS
ncbi:MAG: fibronectin type III domain-containing protein [Verrucomicrobia bacterium]|nr:fibronectin type III domain-containing protein [Verrucomicrobiota bacterium]